jgi:hypothetical protein
MESRSESERPTTVAERSPDGVCANRAGSIDAETVLSAASFRMDREILMENLLFLPISQSRLAASSPN